MQGRRLDTIGLTRRTHEREEQERRPPPTVLALHVGLAAGGARAARWDGSRKSTPGGPLSSGASAFPKAGRPSPLFGPFLIVAKSARTSPPFFAASARRVAADMSSLVKGGPVGQDRDRNNKTRTSYRSHARSNPAYIRQIAGPPARACLRGGGKGAFAFLRRRPLECPPNERAKGPREEAPACV